MFKLCVLNAGDFELLVFLNLKKKKKLLCVK